MDNQDLHPNWKALATADLKWKIFVQAKDTGTQWEGKDEDEREAAQTCPSLSGDGAQKFYEDLLESCSSQGTKAKYKPTKRGGQKVKHHHRHARGELEDQGTSTVNNYGDHTRVCGAETLCTKTINKAFRCAEQNDAVGLRDLLHTGLKVNHKDAFGWSLLMVASCAGAKDAVVALLESGARVGVRDTKGNTALYLATTRGHRKVVDMLISASKGRNLDGRSVEENAFGNPAGKTETEEFFCAVCDKVVRESTEKQHKTSIAHQFCLGAASPQTMYGIPPSNKGYQLLINQGWDADKGLGPKSRGTKFPIKTVLKRDREGLGSEQKVTARVTHFGPADTSAVDRVGKPGERTERERTLSKRERKKQKTREQRKEMELRRELNEPDYL